MNKWIYFLMLLFLQSFCSAQNDSSFVNLNLIFGADRYFPKSNREIYLPDFIQSERASNSELVHDFKNFTDIPQLHASIFAGLITKLSLKEGYDFHFDLFAEDRGQSFGSLALNKVLFYPRVYGEIKDTLSVEDQKIRINLRVGDLLNYRHNYGLTINNIDTQGAVVRIALNNLYLDYALIGDLSTHVGLNIHQFYSYKFGYQTNQSGLNLDFFISYDQYLSFQGNKNSLVAGGEIKNKKSKSFFESAYQVRNQIIALLFGYQRNLDVNKFNLKTQLSYRFYNRAFNSGFLDSGARFRDTSINTLHNNSVGEFLYPLINSYRSFDQWSIYTEYPNQIIHSFRLFIEMKYQLPLKRLSTFVNHEGLLISPDVAENALYNFYEVGLIYSLPLETEFSVYLTNKIMNLDVHYQTFYQAKAPLFGFSIRRTLNYE